ncbi:hypothetical protein [Thalassolituus oleivorans]|uniref:Ner winged helix-turn-helix DNA-binding domain-containing protein n=1 Tax=Thalassolituus oleivorans MIL-1 TaxID=1298593 RepID=M5DP27_9GAMM|nr:hypothetical protein [Thalassolituus oleivorans]CCU70892.1 hypothetical protein TOL_0453 [Thalassolituus oleivorans MIL-1]
MNYESIHTALKSNDLNWCVAATAIGCSPALVMNVCARRTTSRKVANGLSALTGLSVSELFPDQPQYTEHGPSEARASKVEKARLLLSKSA